MEQAAVPAAGALERAQPDKGIQEHRRHTRQGSPPPYQHYRPLSFSVANHYSMESGIHHEEGKLFVGGLDWATTGEKLRDYFSQFGDVQEATVMKEASGISRGFGFVTFNDEAAVDAVLKHGHSHVLDGKTIDPKRAIPREEQDKTEKLFVGGISPEVTEDEFTDFFKSYGKVHDATLMVDRDGQPRGFGFVTFETEDGAENVLRRKDLTLRGKPIEVKRALPKHRTQWRQQSSPPAAVTRPMLGAARDITRGASLPPTSIPAPESPLYPAPPPPLPPPPPPPGAYWANMDTSMAASIPQPQQQAQPQRPRPQPPQQLPQQQPQAFVPLVGYYGGYGYAQYTPLPYWQYYAYDAMSGRGYVSVSPTGYTVSSESDLGVSEDSQVRQGEENHRRGKHDAPTPPDLPQNTPSLSPRSFSESQARVEFGALHASHPPQYQYGRFLG
ncbi:uncharacterized protein VTP21DRAFT_2027 [Calcarisporiella thermophila]|uniref:uncharacterized protein n=1 Tax=Calcarisporiella thermophila TaxID=911321 RepID=UPI003743B6C6